jgi:hypothetical protein
MTKHEIRMTKEARMLEWPNANWERYNRLPFLRASDFLRHSDFVLRHSLPYSLSRTTDTLKLWWPAANGQRRSERANRRLAATVHAL